MNIMEEIFWD